MYIDEEKKFIFFHNPKSGGLTITALLNRYTRDTYNKKTILMMRDFFINQGLSHIREVSYKIALHHMNFSRLCELMPETNWAEYTKFCFVRNPYTHLYSLWLQCTQARHPESNVIIKKSNGDFNKAIRLLTEDNYEWIFELQTNYTHHNETQAMNFIGKFENFTYDLQSICAQIDLPYIALHRNKRGDNNYLQYYTADSIRIVNQYSPKSFAIFGYEMLNPNDFPNHLEDRR